MATDSCSLSMDSCHNTLLSIKYVFLSVSNNITFVSCIPFSYIRLDEKINCFNKLNQNIFLEMECKLQR